MLTDPRRTRAGQHAALKQPLAVGPHLELRRPLAALVVIDAHVGREA